MIEFHILPSLKDGECLGRSGNCVGSWEKCALLRDKIMLTGTNLSEGYGLEEAGWLDREGGRQETGYFKEFPEFLMSALGEQ